jgi:hypothetical protein
MNEYPNGGIATNTTQTEAPGPMEAWLDAAIARAVGREAGTVIRFPEDRDFFRKQDARLAAVTGQRDRLWKTAEYWHHIHDTLPFASCRHMACAEARAALAETEGQP